MTALILLVLFFASFPFLIYLDHKSDKKEEKENESAAKEWLQSQLEQAPFKVVVTTKTGKIYESKFFKPKYETVNCLGGWDYWKYPSKQLAQEKIEFSFANSRYYDEQTDIYIPMCDVEHIKPVQAE